jgi:hypothetical protein
LPVSAVSVNWVMHSVPIARELPMRNRGRCCSTLFLISIECDFFDMISLGFPSTEIEMHVFCFYDKLKAVKAVILMLLYAKVIKIYLLRLFVLF